MLVTVMIRGLRAALADLPSAELGADPKQAVSVTAHDDGGAELAHVEIGAHGLGGYRVDTVSATGFVTDDPSCRAS